MKIIASLRSWVADHRHSALFNKYVVASLVFGVWLAFFDRHNLIVQFKLFSKVKELESEKTEYAERLNAVKREQLILQTQPERYARERYLMHKPDEEVFVIKRK